MPQSDDLIARLDDAALYATLPVSQTLRLLRDASAHIAAQAAEIARLKAVLAEAQHVPAGWQLVPVEATGAMCAHGESRAVDFDCAPADDIANQAMRAIYRAMLAVAPQPNEDK